jgi:Cu+-exporting ATPase
MKTDPVCGMQVNEQSPAASSTYNGEKYVFCSRECKAEFDKHPEDYARPEQLAGESSR